MEEPQTYQDPLWAFLSACGVTAVLAETAQNRFEEADPVAAAAASATPSAGGGSGAGAAAALGRSPVDPDDLVDSDDAAVGEDEAIHAAREVARTAPTLAALHEALRGFEGCPLKHLARTTCLGEGPQGAAIMFVGEAPGREEDEQGRPFVGRSGQLLERMLASIGLTREEVYISNVIPWRPPANRTPSPIETATCEVFVRREIALVGPKVLVALGGAAAKTLFSTDTGIMRQRGRWVGFDAGGTAIDAMAMFHPAYLLRTPGEKARAWQDLLAVRRRLMKD